MILALLGTALSQLPVCRFAPLYTQDQVFNNDTARAQFLDRFAEWEAEFIRRIGVNTRTGMTFDGQRLDYLGGEVLHLEKHYFSASSKESLHVGVMAKVLEGDRRALKVYRPEQVFTLVGKKVASLERFFNRYPGFGGFLPWYNLTSGDLQPTNDFASRTPSLDNGQLFWAAIALSHAWQTNFKDTNATLRDRWDNITWKLMLKNARRVFYNETAKKIRAVADIRDIGAEPEDNQYSNQDDYFLDDPYEGELFAQAITLLSPDFSQQQVETIWEGKRAKLQAVNYTTKANVTITVERGFWFSAHEQWKNLFLPYQLSSTYRRVFRNNERARTSNSRDKGVPGLYAAVTGTAYSNKDSLKYYADCGLPEVSFQKVQHLDIVTPYGSFPLFLQSEKHGAAWLHRQLTLPSAQTVYGAAEGVNRTGANISPMLTWDTKITTLLGVMGGTRTLLEDFLRSRNLLDKFKTRVEMEYATAFKSISGETLDFALPESGSITGRPDYATCTIRKRSGFEE